MCDVVNGILPLNVYYGRQLRGLPSAFARLPRSQYRRACNTNVFDDTTCWAAIVHEDQSRQRLLGKQTLAWPTAPQSAFTNSEHQWDDAAIIIAFVRILLCLLDQHKHLNLTKPIQLLFIPFWVFSIDLSRKRVIGLWPCVPLNWQESVHWEWHASLTTCYLSGLFARVSVALLLFRLFSIKTGVKAFLTVLCLLMTAFVIFNVVTTYHQGGEKVSKINVKLTILAGCAFTSLNPQSLSIANNN